MHVCEIQGHDLEGNGSEKMPFKTTLKAIEQVQGDAKLVMAIRVRKNMEEGYQSIAKAAAKKTLKIYETNVRKAQKAAERAELDAAEAEKARLLEIAKLEEAKKVKLTLDTSLPPATFVRSKTC